LEAMYEIPSRKSLQRCVIDAEAIRSRRVNLQEAETASPTQEAGSTE